MPFSGSFSTLLDHSGSPYPHPHHQRSFQIHKYSSSHQQSDRFMRKLGRTYSYPRKFSQHNSIQTHTHTSIVSLSPVVGMQRTKTTSPHPVVICHPSAEELKIPQIQTQQSSLNFHSDERTTTTSFTCIPACPCQQLSDGTSRFTQRVAAQTCAKLSLAEDLNLQLYPG